MPNKPMSIDARVFATDDSATDLATVLRAWHDATMQAERDQNELREQVQRLRAELADKNCQLAEQASPAQAGVVAAAAIGEMRDEFAPLALHLNLLRRRMLDDPTALDLLRKIECGAAVLETMIDDLSQFTTDGEVCLRPVMLRSLVSEALDDVATQSIVQGVTTTIDVPNNVVLMGDRDLLYRAIHKLMLHALDSMHGGGELVVTAYAGARSVELEIADSGAGLADDSRSATFKPFRLAHGARGVGLAVVQRIAEAHGGDVVARNCAEGGAAITLRIPRRALAAAA